MKVSIILCTYNRANILADTIESFLACKRSGIDHELLVVDNNSQDNTSKVVEQFSSRESTISYIWESMQGLSHARNRGIRCAQGKVIAFVDDDVYFSQNWLVELEETFNDPNIACMGGKSIPLFDAGELPWLTEDILSIYGSTRSGDLPKLMHYPEHPFGLNMAFRREVFETVGLFNPNLGRKGSNLLSNEESELFWRIHCAGLKVAYNPNAIIYHRIPKERSTPEWVLRRYYWQGRSEAVMDRIVYKHSRLQILSKFTDKFFTTLRPTLKGISWAHPKRAYWQLINIPMHQKILLYSLVGYFHQFLVEMFYPRGN
ncbi:glucosyl-dolichyl phosphate glucuronosyltransferase [Methylomarinovum tepidoasis]|uniref:Glucosyl-dolichyl phosphate glucuronosyltransferase n=1 Tax=Methylomarinovum tepidoasis TaxID=2840183 RepID=A0AAU9C706_9GAMM|nr:glycosyltransferase [Methylomarinovum sp. IN45]BCX89352.1 glucosyl-dolichyl phosphate glucuronosyltransferase [Methylomarinovum sp. IN45]